MATKEGRLTNVDCVRVATVLCPSISDIGFLHADLLSARVNPARWGKTPQSCQL